MVIAGIVETEAVGMSPIIKIICVDDDSKGRPCKDESEEACQELEKEFALRLEAAIPDSTKPGA